MNADRDNGSEPAVGARNHTALVASEMRYRHLFDSVREGILILDADTGKIVDVNAFLLKLTGYSHQDFLNKHLWEIGPLKNTASSKDAFAELQLKEHVRYEDLPLISKDGRQIAVEFVSNVYRAGNEKVIQCNIRDTTSRKQGEGGLSDSRMILKTVLDTIPIRVFWKDTKLTYLGCNRAFARDAGFETSEGVVGKDDYAMGWSEQAELYRADDRAVIESGQAKLLVEEPQTTPAGETIHLLTNKVPLRDAKGVIIGVLGTYNDITERKRAEAERDKLQKQLQTSQKMEAIGSLAGGVAHDFNNLLSVILSYTGFVMEELPEGEPLHDDLLEVKKAADRAAVLTGQLLAFGRRQMVQPVSLDINQVAAGLENMLQRILGEDIEFVLELSADLGLTQADPAQIEQMLMNLVANSRDAMPKGGKLTIETSNVEIDKGHATSDVAAAPGPYVQLAVTDTGCGMDTQTKAKLFEPFFTTKEIGKGTGLGLSMVYGMVKQSGGDIWVYSEPGKGSTFKIFLPRDFSAPTVAAVESAVVPAALDGAETILVAEDEEALRKVAQRSLEAAGYRVITASNGEEALLVSEKHAGNIHLLLTDVVMPRMGGGVLAQELLKMRPSVKVIYMSGYTEDTIGQHGVLEQGTHFIAKPFSSTTVTQKVREVLDEGVPLCTS